MGTYGYTANYEEALDLGDVVGQFASSSYVSDVTHAYFPAFVLDEEAVEFSSANYVSSAAKVYSPLTVDIGDISVEFGRLYTKAGPIRTYSESALVEMFALPVVAGDTGQVIVFGRLQDEGDPNFNPAFDGARGVVMIPLNFTRCLMLGHSIGSIYEGALLIKYEERSDYQDIITI